MVQLNVQTLARFDSGGLVQHVAAYERLAAEAAVTRDLTTARKALLAHPLIGQHAKIDALAESMLAETVS